MESCKKGVPGLQQFSCNSLGQKRGKQRFKCKSCGMFFTRSDLGQRLENRFI
ncbi:MAG: hypothetical protein M3342_09720 [Bacteroidota bacterium]|nr:hypothetical protein [Flavisolibacter sp.]MBD0297167.1 hypothetical protein [Flavisolibacter sp.]MDQ3844277.1 hypothetical protein [Bacteroidota bacterium]